MNNAPSPLAIPRFGLWVAAILSITAACLLPQTALAQIENGDSATDAEASDPEPVIDATPETPTDQAIRDRLIGIFTEIDPLANVGVEVNAGVVSLSGTVATNADIERAGRIAARVAGVVTVENALQRNLEIADNLDPLADQVSARLGVLGSSLPLFAIALAIVAAFWIIGSLLARAKWLWRAITPNAFLAELVATGIRFALIVIGLILALDLLEATALLGAFLGSAGVIGLAVGFAIRDTVDNYVSSIMLSIRQPFRANDHVVIGQFEGHVIRLTSRATILMTLDGNHLRVPNSTVFKSEILNYTTNPQRRMSFSLGVDAEDDPVAAITTGLERINSLPFALANPAAEAHIENVGDSNIVIDFTLWIDQRETSFLKARTSAIRAVMRVLDEQGFGLPEPIYRLRFDSATPLAISGRDKVGEDTSVAGTQKDDQIPRKLSDAPPADEQQLNTDADTSISRKVEDERHQSAEDDILDENRPLE